MDNILENDDNDFYTTGAPRTTVNATDQAASVTDAAASQSYSPERRRPPLRQVSSIDEPIVKTGIWGTSSNLVNSIVGAGIIGIPYAISTSGLVAGVLLLLLVGVFTDKSLRMIIELATFHPQLHNCGVLTFEDLMTIPFGRFGRIFILTSMFVLAYGAMVAYLLIVKDNIPTVLGLGDSFLDREVVMLVTSLLIMLPLSMLRDISQLAFTSSLSVLADVLLIIIVCAFAPIGSSVAQAGGLGQVLENSFVRHQLFIGLGILSTALACQHSSFLISGSLKNSTPQRWQRVTCLSVSISTALCLILGVVGYLGFLDQTQGDVLNNFPSGTHVVNAARVLLSITMFLTYPMESFVARHVIIQIRYHGNMDNASVGPNGEQIPEKKFLGCLGRRERWTIFLYIIVLIPALLVSDLGPVLSLTGSLGASCIAYIGPGLAFLGLNGSDFLDRVGQMLHNRGYKQKHNKATNVSHGDIELPVVGDADARMATTTEASSLYDSVYNVSKPWWWCICGFPIWVAIARRGAHNSKLFLTRLHDEQAPPSPATGSLENLIAPTRRDYIYSIVFIIFGVVAAVFGVASNIYLQVHQVFFHS